MFATASASNERLKPRRPAIDVRGKPADGACSPEARVQVIASAEALGAGDDDPHPPRIKSPVIANTKVLGAEVVADVEELVRPQDTIGGRAAPLHERHALLGHSSRVSVIIADHERRASGNSRTATHIVDPPDLVSAVLVPLGFVCKVTSDEGLPRRWRKQQHRKRGDHRVRGSAFARLTAMRRKRPFTALLRKYYPMSSSRWIAPPAPRSFRR